MIEIFLENEQETKRLGLIISKFLTSKDTVLISGELGAGKTVLVKGIAMGFGVDERNVHSPSYTYVKKYYGRNEINHIDLYLLNDFSDVYQIGVEELLGEEMCLIEWGNKYQELDEPDYWKVAIYYHNDGLRKITIEAPKEKKSFEEEILKLWRI